MSPSFRTLPGGTSLAGPSYDALIARCALKAGADEIFTWSIRHYQLFGPEVAKRLKTPVL